MREDEGMQKRREGEVSGKGEYKGGGSSTREESAVKSEVKGVKGKR